MSLQMPATDFFKREMGSYNTSFLSFSSSSVVNCGHPFMPVYTENPHSFVKSLTVFYCIDYIIINIIISPVN